MQNWRSLLSDSRLRMSALMTAAVVAAWALAFVPDRFAPAAQDASPAAAVLAAQGIDLNRLIDFIGSAGLFMLSGITAGLVLFCLDAYPKIKAPQQRPDRDCPWQARDIVFSAALFFFVQAACAAAGHPLQLRLQPGHDHSYYFIASFLGDHFAHHAAALGR